MSRVNDLEAELEMERRIAADNLAAYEAAIDREARLRASLNAIANNVLTDPREAARAALATTPDDRERHRLSVEWNTRYLRPSLATTPEDES